MPGLVPGIHIFAWKIFGRKTWMAGTGPATVMWSFLLSLIALA